MSTLLQKDLKVNRIVTTNVEQAKALDDKARIKILQTLYRKQLSAEQIADELHKAGYNKATTTIRYHLDVLKNAGLVEIVRMEEIRGAVMKFYGTSINLLGYTIPPNFDSEFLKTITDTSVKMEKIIKNLAQKSTSKIKKKNLGNGENSEQDYDKYVLLEIVNRAVTNVFENNGFSHNALSTRKRNFISKK
ncbi:MAG: winged helix-turn-helix domain-containing protein [Nitrosopumilaceae archaeon]